MPNELSPIQKVLAGERALPEQEMTATIEHIDEENRSVTFSFSSEYEVQRWYGIEVLDHSEGAVRLERINNGGAFLMDHNRWDQRGVVLSAEIKDKRGVCSVKLSRNERGEELWQDILDGIRTQVSLHYIIHEMVLEKREGDLEYYRVTDWEPTEISSVSIAADPSVGMGRSQDAGGKPQTLNPVTIKGVRAMDDESVEVEAPEASKEKPAAAARSGGAPAAKPAVKPAEKPVDHAREIAAIGNEYGQPELAMRAIADGKTVDQFKDDLLQQHQERSSSGDAKSTVVGLGDLGLTDKERAQYSVLGAIRGLLNPKLAGFEREISEELADKTGSDVRGILVPYDVMGYGLRQQEVGTAAKGGDLVGQELHFDKFIEALRQGTVLGSLGARVLTGLVGNVDIPKQTGKATFAWVGEDGDSTDSDVDFGLVSLSPETVTASVPLTRRVMQQTGGSMEMLVRQDLMAGVYEALDTRLLTDILATAGIGAVPFAAAGAPTWAEVVGLETEVAEANALRNSPAYLMRPALKGKLKTTAKAANTAEFIWANNEVNGYRGADITSMVASKILFGDFSQAMIGLWGALDLTVDKSTKAKSGGTVLRLFQDADTAVRHAGAFALGQ